MGEWLHNSHVEFVFRLWFNALGQLGEDVADAPRELNGDRVAVAKGTAIPIHFCQRENFTGDGFSGRIAVVFHNLERNRHTHTGIIAQLGLRGANVMTVPRSGGF